MKITYEYCPHCGEEVILKAERSVQKCPNCGKWIVACSMCDGCINGCALDMQAMKLNNMSHEYYGDDNGRAE